MVLPNWLGTGTLGMGTRPRGVRALRKVLPARMAAPGPPRLADAGIRTLGREAGKGQWRLGSTGPWILHGHSIRGRQSPNQSFANHSKVHQSQYCRASPEDFTPRGYALWPRLFSRHDPIQQSRQDTRPMHHNFISIGQKRGETVGSQGCQGARGKKGHYPPTSDIKR
jgi:hypothetical protein